MMLQARRIFRFHVFVSYEANNSQSAIALTHGLQRVGLRIWLDRDTGEHARDPRSPGDTRGKPIAASALTVRDVLQEAIGLSILLVVITSEQTLASAWVRTEIQIARGMQMPLFF